MGKAWDAFHAALASNFAARVTLRLNPQVPGPVAGMQDLYWAAIARNNIILGSIAHRGAPGNGIDRRAQRFHVLVRCPCSLRR
jgi:hypothetical protein